MTDRPLLAISTCLLGENVRYDGNHKLDRFVRDVLGKYVDFYPICPETECGMPTPREALRLVDTDKGVRLLTRNTGDDKTQMMTNWTPSALERLAELPLCGFVFEGKSPSSGYKRVKVYNGKGGSRKGNGLFTEAVINRFPLLPFEDDGRLNDAKLRENFIERIFIAHRWNQLKSQPLSFNAIMRFHAQHKYLLMAHDPVMQKTLGALIANTPPREINDLITNYETLLFPMLIKKATVKKHCNVLQHIMGYFKKELSADEKQELLDIIDRYRLGQLPLIVPITLINHYVRKYEPPYLLDQVYLNPHPLELMLRNHV